MRPLCLGASGSVRATSIPRSAMWASVFHTFCPVMTHSSPSRTARVARPARSEPGARLAEQLAPRLLAGEGPAQQPAAQLVGAVGHHRGAGHGQPEELPGARRGGAGLGQPPVDDALEVGRRGPARRSPRGTRSRPARGRTGGPGTPRRSPSSGRARRGAGWSAPRRASCHLPCTKHTARHRTGPGGGRHRLRAGAARPASRPRPARSGPGRGAGAGPAARTRRRGA